MLIDLQNIVLQAQQQTTDYSGWIVGGITALILGITFAYNISITKQNSKVRRAQLLNDFAKDLEKHTEKEPDLETTEQCRRYVVNYLNILDRLAYLYLEDEQIPREILLFFVRAFNYGLTLRKWYSDNTELTMDRLEKNWPNFDRWCSNNNYEALPETSMPDALTKYQELKQTEEAERRAV